MYMNTLREQLMEIRADFPQDRNFTSDTCEKMFIPKTICINGKHYLAMSRHFDEHIQQHHGALSKGNSSVCAESEHKEYTECHICHKHINNNKLKSHMHKHNKKRANNERRRAIKKILKAKNKPRRRIICGGLRVVKRTPENRNNDERNKGIGILNDSKVPSSNVHKIDKNVRRK